MTPPSAKPVEVQISTSDQKRGPARKLITQLVAELGDVHRPARVLNCMGLRSPRYGLVAARKNVTARSAAAFRSSTDGAASTSNMPRSSGRPSTR
jgi:hypothetical protein